MLMLSNLGFVLAKMSGIPSVTIVLLIFYLASSTAFKWVVLSDIKYEDRPSTSEASHELLLKLLPKKSLYELVIELRSEFHTMAIGKDFYRFTANENENKEYHAISQATLTLDLNLKYTNDVSNIIKVAIENGAASVQKQSNITVALPVIKENIETMMQQTPTLYKEYKRLKSEALAKPLPSDYKVYYYEIPKTLNDVKKMAVEVLNDPYLKKVQVHSTFDNQTRLSDASSRESFLVAKSILQLVKDPGIENKVQELYDEAVAEIADKLNFDSDNVFKKHTTKGFVQIGKQFFDRLDSKFGNDTIVKTKFVEAKYAISKSL